MAIEFEIFIYANDTENVTSFLTGKKMWVGTLCKELKKDLPKNPHLFFLYLIDFKGKKDEEETMNHKHNSDYANNS